MALHVVERYRLIDGEAVSVSRSPRQRAAESMGVRQDRAPGTVMPVASRIVGTMLRSRRG
jgi:hypothetical protein